MAVGERFVSRHTSAALAEKRMYDAAGACGLVADPSRGIALSPRSARPADPRTGLIVSHQGWDTTQAVSGCGGGSSWDRTPRWTTLMWRKTISSGPLPCTGLQLAGLVLYPEPTE